MEEYGDGLLNSNYEGNVYTCQNGFPSFQDIPSGWCLHDCSADQNTKAQKHHWVISHHTMGTWKLSSGSLVVFQKILPLRVNNLSVNFFVNKLCWHTVRLLCNCLCCLSVAVVNDCERNGVTLKKFVL